MIILTESPDVTYFKFKNGKVERAVILSETPFSYFVQFSDQVFGTIYKNELVEEPS